MLPLSSRKTRRKPAWATWSIVAVCLAVFVLQLQSNALDAAWMRWALVPSRLPGGPATWATLITHMFLHGGLLHLLGNLWHLHLFGGHVEDALGSRRFAWFYAVCGLLAAALHVVSNPASSVPMVGASGAISGVMGGFLRLHPGERISMWFILFTKEVPAWLFLGSWAALQVVDAFSSLEHGRAQVAFWAHVGGFVGGVAWVSVLKGRA